MVEGTETDAAVAPGRLHIIKRPRLTRLLDETEARIIMLIAPAGYGKTTLAQEWLGQGERQWVWYSGGPASSDVAALASGLAKALEAITPGLETKVRAHSAASESSERSAEVFAALFAEELHRWPTDAWLAIDDYQFLTPSRSAENLVAILVDTTPLNILVASRQPPAWSSARRILYGEALQIGKESLALQPEEVERVLASAPNAATMLGAIAGGWPAIVGLAALAGDVRVPVELPGALYDYFAEEIYRLLPNEFAEALELASLAPDYALLILEALGSTCGLAALEHGRDLGLLEFDGTAMAVHPLLREFLLGKVRERNGRDLYRLLGAAVGTLTEAEAWDDAFFLIELFDTVDLLPDVLCVALLPLLSAGRLASLSNWVGYARDHGLDDPMIDAAAAEVLFRQGSHDASAARALHAARLLGPDHPLASRVHFRAGQAMYFASRFDEAVRLCEEAERLAQTEEDRRAALLGQMHSVAKDRGPDPELSRRFIDALEADPSREIRIAQANLVIANYSGGIEDALSFARPAVHLLSQAEPLLRTGFNHTYAYALTLSGRYEEAKRVARANLDEVRRYGFDFAAAECVTLLARAELGARDFVEAERHFDQSRRLAESQGRLYDLLNGLAARASLHIARGDLVRAIELTDVPWPSLRVPGLLGEFLAVRALALACAGMCAEAVKVKKRAEEATDELETTCLVPFVDAIVSLRTGAANARKHATTAFVHARARGGIFGFVTAYRGFPPLLIAVAEQGYQEDLRPILARANDRALGELARIFPTTVALAGTARLSPREREVLALLGRSMSNRDIAKCLYISESTAKVHVRKILEKLGVRSRTEAALFAAQGWSAGDGA